MSCIAPMDFLILDILATLPCKLLVALPYKFFYLPEDESVVGLTRLSAVRSNANSFRIRSETTLLAG